MISVTLPAVKTKFLSKSIESILNQSYNDFELIIVNSGAPEDIGKIVRNYSDSRIRYIEHQEKIPIIANWNRCLNYAEGEYFVLFSDDDVCDNTFLEELNHLSLKYPECNIFRVRTKIIDENDNTIAISSSAPEFESAVNFVWHRVKMYRLHYAPDFMCRTAVLKKKGGFVDFPNAWGSDDATWFTIANTGGIACTSKILCSWRDSSYNVTKGSKIKPRLEALKNYNSWLNNFINNELVVGNDETEIFNEIKKSLFLRKVYTDGMALKLSAGTKIFGLIKIFFNWLKYRKDYALSFFSMVWGMGLVIKELKIKKP